MEKKVISIDDKKIEIFDNALTFEERFFLYNYALNSKYQLSRYTDTTPESSKYPKTLQCDFNLKDILNSNILRNDTVQSYLKENGLRVYRAYINLCIPSDIYKYHIDGNSHGKTCLYYMNTDWMPEWEGETIFSMDRMNIDYSSSFIPGRLIFFDPTIPHKSTQPSYDAKYHRFVLVLKLVNKFNTSYSNSFHASDFNFSDKVKMTEHEKDCIDFAFKHTNHLQHYNNTLFNHLLNTFYILKNMGAESDVCLAGLFHSVFGTDFYNSSFQIPEITLKKLIGDRSFFIVKTMCANDRTFNILDNHSNLPEQVWKDVLQVFYANLIEMSYYSDQSNYDVLFHAKARLDKFNNMDKTL